MEDYSKKLLILQASEDISELELVNVVSQVKMFGIETDRRKVSNYEELFSVLHSGEEYDYIYLATHGCETSWGNVSGTLEVTWLEFAALICHSGVSKPGAVFMHSCCRGGLNQVAWEMFACCNTIDFICGPRQNLRPVDLITAFNIFLYNVEVKRTDPVVAAEKVLHATDLRLICFDKLETTAGADYENHYSKIESYIGRAFEKIESLMKDNKDLLELSNSRFALP